MEGNGGARVSAASLTDDDAIDGPFDRRMKRHDYLLKRFEEAAIAAFTPERSDLRCLCGAAFSAENVKLDEWKSLTRIWWKLHCGPGHGPAGPASGKR